MEQLQLPHDPLKNGIFIYPLAPPHQMRILGVEHRMEDLHGIYHSAHREKVGKCQLVTNQILVFKTSADLPPGLSMTVSISAW
jgi:hypothetical protein